MGINMGEPFNKPALNLNDQINLLVKRGLAIANRDRAVNCLEFIGYYRLSAYMLPFQQKEEEGANRHIFKPGVTFGQILKLYVFDRKLRLLVLDAVERIEIALRSVISNTLSIDHGPHWYTDPAHFKEEFDHGNLLIKIKEGIREVEARNPSIKHYFSKYNSPNLPPSWMIFEVLPFGRISHIFGALDLQYRKTIAKRFCLHYTIFYSWIHNISILRNICAHQGRVWNRNFGVKPKAMKNLAAHFDDNSKFYAQAVVIKVLLDVIAGHSLWADRLKELLEEYPSASPAVMGFPVGWEETTLWKPKGE